MPANELKPCPTMGSKCRGCPDCPGASSTGLKSGDITNEAARKELELWFPKDVGAREVERGKA